ncbi:MAG: DEAD/DEAH box helicase, partial [Erysipelotrichaceae bacterium]|nr:DEAD/DEAH box helicase [Erysipelotrichaceae bacterium]
MNFNELNLSPELLRAVEDMGYTQTTSIQEKTIPVMLQGLDLIGQSQTGTGKTAAFGLPLIQSIVPSD